MKANLLRRFNLINRIFILIISLFFMTTIAAGIPVWIFTPLNNTAVTVRPTETITIQYLVTNQSITPHILVMIPISGIAQISAGAGTCPNPFILGYQQSCNLTLQVNGSALTGDILGGPLVCEQANPLQCYQPDENNRLAIRLSR